MRRTTQVPYDTTGLASNDPPSPPWSTTATLERRPHPSHSGARHLSCDARMTFRVLTGTPQISDYRSSHTLHRPNSQRSSTHRAVARSFDRSNPHSACLPCYYRFNGLLGPRHSVLCEDHPARMTPLTDRSTAPLRLPAALGVTPRTNRLPLPLALGSVSSPDARPQTSPASIGPDATSLTPKPVRA